MNDDDFGWLAHTYVCVSKYEGPLKMFMTVVGKFYSIPIGKELCREVYMAPDMHSLTRAPTDGHTRM